MSLKAFGFSLFFACALFTMTGQVLSQVPLNPADIVILNGVVLQPHQTFVNAIAIKQQKILALGSDSEIQKYLGPNTQKINAKGHLIIPGLIDSHIHAIRAGLSFQHEVSWSGVTSIEQAIDRIQKAAMQKPAGTWIVIAGGWVPEQFQNSILPTQEQLLQAAGNHPLYLQKLYSSVFVSPGGLETLGVAANAELLSRLTVAVDTKGKPTGWMSGSARTISDLFDFLPQPSSALQYESTKLFFKELNRFGITGVLDPGGYNFPLESYHSLWKLHKEKNLSIRIAYSLSAPKRDTELADFKEILQKIPKSDEFLQWNGIGENVTWGMYNNESPTITDQQKLQEVLEWAAKEKITVTLHWNNNESIPKLLEVIERVQEKYSIQELRWSIAHINNLDEMNLRRMKKSHLGWLVQNALYFQANGFADKYGREALKISPRLRQAINLQLPLGLGTDAHRVMGFNPFDAIEWFITGKGIDGKPGRESEQLLTIYEALQLYTRGSAQFLPDGSSRGELTVGKYADLAILSQNIFKIPTHRIHRTTAELTMVGGKTVFIAEDFFKK